MSAQAQPWWRGGVIYQIYPRSFCDSNGDGVGDLAGIAARLEHVARLGVDAIWISPFFKSPMKDFGYDVSDYRDVDPVFGTLDDFRKVLDQAHALGLKVLIDQVWSHSSDQHAWFKESRRDRTNARHDWYVWADPKPDGTAPNNWLSYFGGPAWTWDARREQYYLHHFLKGQPNLNLWNPAVREGIKQIAAFWLDMGVDGFRLDAIHTYLSDRALHDNPVSGTGGPSDMPASNPMSRQSSVHTFNLPENLDWAAEIAAHINKWPDRCVLAEIGGADSEALVAKYTAPGRFQQGYSFGLVGSSLSKDEVLTPLRRVAEVMRDGWICWTVSNHDFKRVASRIPGDVPLKDKAAFATALGLSLRGSYCMYQGEELGLPQAELAFEDLVDPYDISLYPEHVGRDGCRTPMPWVKGAPQAGFSTAVKTWLPVVPAHLPLAVDAQEEDQESVLHVVRELLSFRRERPGLRHGDCEIIETPDPVLAFRRIYEGRVVTCVFNCSPAPAVVVLNAGKLVESVSRNIAAAKGGIELQPYGYGFFE
jgi:alpha-glucosidase